MKSQKRKNPKKPNSFTLEWKEHGRWVPSINNFKSEQLAKEHAEMLGSKTFRVLPGSVTTYVNVGNETKNKSKINYEVDAWKSRAVTAEKLIEKYRDIIKRARENNLAIPLDGLKTHVILAEADRLDDK